MCGSNPEVAPEVNKAKCFAGCALGFGIVTLLGFGVPGGGWVSSIGGLLGLIAGSMLCCCGPKSPGQGGGIHIAAAVLGIISSVCYLVGTILCIVVIIQVNTEVNDAIGDDACKQNCDDADPSSYSEYYTVQDCKDFCDSELVDGIQDLATTATLVFTLALGVPTIIFSLIALGLQIPMIVFCFKAKKAIDAEAGGPTVK